MWFVVSNKTFGDFRICGSQLSSLREEFGQGFYRWTPQGKFILHANCNLFQTTRNQNHPYQFVLGKIVLKGMNGQIGDTASTRQQPQLKRAFHNVPHRKDANGSFARNWFRFLVKPSVYSTCKMPHMRHKNASYEARKNVLRASQPGTLFTQAYEELTMGIPSVLTAIERHTLNQSNFKQ
jgi:hypothetical protein